MKYVHPRSILMNFLALRRRATNTMICPIVEAIHAPMTPHVGISNGDIITQETAPSTVVLKTIDVCIVVEYTVP